MTVWHKDFGKKVTGGRITKNRKKRIFEKGSLPLNTELGKEKKFLKRIKGGGTKIKLVSGEFINVVDLKGKTKKTKILDVLENLASPNYVRRGIITKGTIVKTELGKVKVTSRPSQDGVLNGVLMQKS